MIDAPRRAARRERLASRSARARSSASPASPATARASSWRRSPACAGRSLGTMRFEGRRIGLERAQPAPHAPARAAARAGGPPAHGPRPGLPGLRERRARLHRRAAASGAGRFSTMTAWSSDLAAKMEHYDVRPPAPRLKTSKFSGGNQQKIVLAREIEREPEGAARRPADARRRYRRHRVHPPPAHRPARRRRRHSSRLGRARRDHEPVGPHPRHVRRPASPASARPPRPTSGISACSWPAIDRRGRLMQPRITLVTLGVTDLAEVARLLRGLGLEGFGSEPGGESCSSRRNGLALALFGRADARRGRGRRGSADRLCGHLARLQRALEGRGRRGLSPARSRPARARQAAAGRVLGRLFGLFRRPRRPSLGGGLESVLPHRRAGPPVSAGSVRRERSHRPAQMGRHIAGARPSRSSRPFSSRGSSCSASARIR